MDTIAELQQTADRMGLRFDVAHAFRALDPTVTMRAAPQPPTAKETAAINRQQATITRRHAALAAMPAEFGAPDLRAHLTGVNEAQRYKDITWMLKQGLIEEIGGPRPRRFRKTE